MVRENEDLLLSEQYCWILLRLDRNIHPSSSLSCLPTTLLRPLLRFLPLRKLDLLTCPFSPPESETAPIGPRPMRCDQHPNDLSPVSIFKNSARSVNGNAPRSRALPPTVLANAVRSRSSPPPFSPPESIGGATGPPIGPPMRRHQHPNELPPATIFLRCAATNIQTTSFVQGAENLPGNVLWMTPVLRQFGG